MEPEQLYQEVLKEEQQKGSSPAVAEGRAKAARQRAIEGSPHPKEPKWWPGSQPQFEGDGAAPAEAEEEAAPAEEEAAPAEEEAAPAEEEAAPAEEEVAPPAAEEEPAPAQAPAAEAPAPAPAAESPAEAPAAQSQPAAVATAPATPAAAPSDARPPGVSHGVPTGTRLRPEDAVSTEAQFDGQRAMEQRRKLIDELVQTGVPAVTASQTAGERSPWLSLMFLIIPIAAVVILVLVQDELGAGAGDEPGGGGGPEGDIVALDTQFNVDELTLTAGEDASVVFVNQDPLAHNWALYTDTADAEAQENAIADGQEITEGSDTIEFTAPDEPGEYPFQCDLHPTSMTGVAIVEPSSGGGEGGDGGSGDGGGGDGGG